MWEERERSGQTTRRGEDLDELQRGQEQPITLELMERVPTSERQTRPVPHPGARPGAIRAGEEAPPPPPPAPEAPPEPE